MKINSTTLNPTIKKNKSVSNPQGQAPLSLRSSQVKRSERAKLTGGEVVFKSMKYFYIPTALLLFLSSCSNSFINQKLQFEKIGTCTNEVLPTKMISNINGERYEFNYCLEEDFDGKNFTVVRNGDSLLVQFPAVTKKTALFKLTLDIDAKPAYHHIKLGDGQTIEVVPTDKF